MKLAEFIKLIILSGLLLFPACGKKGPVDYPVKPVPFTEVEIEDEFWLPRIETNRTITIPFAMKMNRETGRVDNFAVAAGLKEGRYQGRRFNDTDVYKVIEGAAYSLQVHYDEKLVQEIDEIIELIAAAQEEDGYLYPARTAHPGDPVPGAGPERWSRLRGSHELYNSGHLFEAAVAYYQATGKKQLLDVALKNADLLVKTFGPDKRHDVPGHQEVEIGLCKLYRLTGNKKYLDLAEFFLDERGKPHKTGFYPEDSPFAIYNGSEYMQDHKPVVEQEEAVGHAVRATYMYSAMADVAALTGNVEYVKAIDRLWENVVGKKMYLTGGVGARHTSEAFGDNYELPNLSAYTETCAAVGMAMWNHRMFLLHGESKYIDVLERVIYNGLLSGVSLEGDKFFYQNPLASKGGYERSPWFEVSCCPGNIVRFIPSFPGYIYAVKDNSIYVNLFVKSRASLELDGETVSLSQKTRYPWEGTVVVEVNVQSPVEFTLMLRVPGWAGNQPVPKDLYRYLSNLKENPVLLVNDKPYAVETKKGYFPVRRKWQDGDKVELILPMPVRKVLSHEKVENNRGKIALQRGPLVYCLEEADNGRGLMDIVLPDEVNLWSSFRPHLLGGVVVISTETGNSSERVLYGKELTAVPYYAWAHRGAGEMIVWIKRGRRSPKGHPFS